MVLKSKPSLNNQNFEMHVSKGTERGIDVFFCIRVDKYRYCSFGDAMGRSLSAKDLFVLANVMPLSRLSMTCKDK